MDQGYNQENADLASKAVKRLNVFKLAVEYLYHRDQYNPDELEYAQKTELVWPNLTEKQKDVVYMHMIQGFTFTSIGDLQGYTRKNAAQHFYLACKKFQSNA